MPRGASHSEQARLTAKLCFQLPGFRNKEIANLLSRMAQPEDVDEATIRQWRRRWRAEQEEAAAGYLDSDFSWPDLVRKNKVSDQSGHYLRDLWTSRMSVDANGDPVSILRRAQERLRLTNRDAIWASRVHDVAEDLSFDDTYLLARVYSHREQSQRNDNYKGSVVYGDLDAYVAFRPWADSDSHRNYLVAMKNKDIRPIDIFELELLALGAAGNLDADSGRLDWLQYYQAEVKDFGWEWRGVPSYTYLDRCTDAWLSDAADGHGSTWSVPCPYPTPTELLAWAKLFNFLKEADANSDKPMWPLYYWEGAPPFQYDYKKLVRIVSLIGLTQHHRVEEGLLGRKGTLGPYSYEYFERIERIENEFEKAGLRNLVSCIPYSG